MAEFVTPAPPETKTIRTSAQLTRALFLVSVLSLFLELMLIRWIGTEIRIFAYLQNTVLVVCFMGLGMGCFSSHRPVVLRGVLMPLLVLTVLLAIPVTRRALGKTSDLLSVLGDFVIWQNSMSANVIVTVLSMTFGLAITFLLMVLIHDMFVPLGRILGRLLDEHPRTIWAYSVNVAGSLVGIWLFVLLSALYQPPLAWFVVTVILFLLLYAALGHRQKMDTAILVFLLPLSWLAGQEPRSREAIWSPYQKLVLSESTPSQSGLGAIGTYLLTVNNTGYQALIDLDEASVMTDSERFSPEMQGLSQYDVPALLHPTPQRVLIVGAGAGNDAAGALRNGADHVIAVEIDPVIIEIGRRYHPEKPYDSSRVTVMNDDARSFFANCKQRFDVIVFGLLDSHTTTAMTNARLDHYVYTRESIERAKTLLAPDGIMVLCFEAQKPFIADRMARVLYESFEQKPLCFRIPRSAYGWGGVMFVTGNLTVVADQLAQNSRLASLIAQWQSENPVNLSYSTRVAVDDWPYIYLKDRRIPVLYYLLGVMLLGLLLRGAYQSEAWSVFRGWGIVHWHFFFLGAAFLLLEVQNISKASVVFGNTWWVNAIIISGVLAMVLAANALATTFPRLPLGMIYCLLYGTCILLYFVDLASFAFLPAVPKAVLVGGLTTLPILFSGIVFVRSFASVPAKGAALGANLFGALVGGVFQSLTFVVGIRALLLVVCGFYFCAMITRPRQ